MSRRADRCLDDLAREAARRHMERRALIFLEEASAFAAEIYGGRGAAELLREMAEHLEMNT